MKGANCSPHAIMRSSAATRSWNDLSTLVNIMVWKSDNPPYLETKRGSRLKSCVRALAC